jgi:hypothetical protein
MGQTGSNKRGYNWCIEMRINKCIEIGETDAIKWGKTGA